MVQVEVCTKNFFIQRRCVIRPKVKLVTNSLLKTTLANTRQSIEPPKITALT